MGMAKRMLTRFCFFFSFPTLLRVMMMMTMMDALH